MDDELNRFKSDINLSEFAASLGYQLVQRERSHGCSGGSSTASVVMRHPATDDKIVIRRDRDQHWTYFSVRDDEDNGTILDFLQRRRGANLGVVRQDLRHWLGTGRPHTPPTSFQARVVMRGRALDAVQAEYDRAQETCDSPYLHSRGIRPATLDGDRFHGSFRLDGRGNVLFPHRHPEDSVRIAGFEKKNRGFTGFATGGMKTFWVSQTDPNDQRLVIVEGAIDALSYHQLNPHPLTRYMSTAGAVGAAQLDLVGRAIAALPVGSGVIVASDNDPAGEKLALQIQSVAGSVPISRHRSPVGKDWNDYLRERERDYIQSLNLTQRRRLKR